MEDYETLITQLDSVLDRLESRKPKEGLTRIDLISSANTYYLKPKGVNNISDNTFDFIIQKLIEDGYAIHVSSYNYSITTKGIFFHLSGGYNQEIINDDVENIRLEKLEKNQMAIQIAIVVLTGVLAFVGVAELYLRYFSK